TSQVDVLQSSVRDVVPAAATLGATSAHIARLDDPVVPIGIITEQDMVQFQALELDLGRLTARELMSAPLMTARPDDSLWSAHQMMQQSRIRRLVVTDDDGYLQGILTQTTVLNVLDPVELYVIIESLRQTVDAQTIELQRQHLQYQQLMHSLSDPESPDRPELIGRLHSDGRLSFVNGTMSRALGKPATALIGDRFVEWLSAPTPVPLIDMLAQLQQPDSSLTLDLEVVSHAGDRLQVQWTISPILDHHGQISEYHLVGTCADSDPKPWPAIAPMSDSRDRLRWGAFTTATATNTTTTAPLCNSPRTVGDRLAMITLLQQEIAQCHQAEAALRQSEAEFRAVVENSPDVIMRLDRAFCYLYVNPAVEQTLGLSAAAMVGQPFDHAPFPRLLLDNWKVAMERAFTTGQEQTLEYEVPDPAATSAIAPSFQRSKYYVSRIVPERGPDRAVNTLLVIARDITARKQAEESLYQQSQRDRLLAEITQHIRHSLNLETILTVAATEVSRLIHADRVLIYRLNPDWSGEIAAEWVSASRFSLIGRTFYDECFAGSCGESYRQGRITAIHDTQRTPPQNCYGDFLAELEVRAILVVPILQDTKLWGLFIMHYCTAPHDWQTWEIDLMEQLTAQSAIAIHQSELYHRLQEANLELQRLALLDGLTRVANRRCFDEQLAKEWHRLTREQLPLSVIMCDVDQFKQFNDIYGHLAGDECLIQISQALLKASRRPADLVARYGGEEFVLILPNTDSAGAAQVAIAIQQRLGELKIPHSGSLLSRYVTVSVGVATIVPQQAIAPKYLIDAADQALYEAKGLGRNTICLRQL
ncbi:MAG TPA: diguanylate cyclase, partial [Chroococcidiopsis sp.]